MHVEECRQQIAELPFYTTVSAKVKKYIQLYTDIQAYRVLPPKIRDNYLKSWAGCYTLRGPDTSCWEFAAASESLLCVFALYVSAFDPLLMQEDVKSIESTYFPWLCCYQTLLEHYAAPREILLGEELNYTDCYKNLKTCEERLDTLMKKSAEACKYLNNSNFHLIIIKILTAVYLSDPRASFGIKRLSSQSLLGKSLYKTEAYFHICRALRFLSVI
jgi:tetraprenyl-beta-curcumene synthase